MAEIESTKYLSSRVAGLKPSGIRKFFDIAATMKDVISLGIGEPDFTTPKPILEAGIRSLQRGETHYTSNAGRLELRQAIADNLFRLYGVKYDPVNEIIATVGVSEALYLAMTAILDPGDEVIIPTPCFVSYQAEVILAGGVPVEIPARMEDDFQVDPERIRAAITPRTKAIFVGYPSNPSGAVASRERLTEIADIAERNDLVFVSDEIYDRLVYDFQHVCVPTLGESIKRRTILLGGLSKDYAMTGWRIGYAAGPADLIKGLVRVHQYTIMSAPTIAQDAAIEALTNGEPYVQEMLAEYNRRRRLLVDGLNRLGLQTFEPRGAFYAFPKIAASGLDDEAFAEKLLKEEHVAVVPGNAFGPGGEGFVRACYATEYSKIEEALHRMERFMQRHG
ncbi:MAG: aminotransferase [Anaerolineaceae bacterium]|jgi:aminotransferase|nr:pyridoxal phosphate-dependent aminotransferase [Anaerolineae bacterium]MBV6466981.1 Aspartate aminotransferase [Anaerolineales bacterium]MDL1925127.1 pyridoxal phosphate-dependent aminotransferase [Anaerolineae bacterium AMX1]GER78135.1 aminotransferase class I/II-fold pyridoxal phosphate-dependent enzyme [Candidatus Denitrolinea symbiosum]GIK09752.1 MAG: aminotransferase [Chloroflexota bacterium]GJQ38738.1 MAG: aminotransferase [Anaerolineaceae bacterium]